MTAPIVRPATPPPDESWRNLAACAGEHVELFFPEPGPNTQVWTARSWYCNVCPVKTICGEYAIVNHIDHGIWGGLTVSERRMERHERSTQQVTAKGQTK